MCLKVIRFTNNVVDFAHITVCGIRGDDYLFSESMNFLDLNSQTNPYLSDKYIPPPSYRQLDRSNTELGPHGKFLFTMCLAA